MMLIRKFAATVLVATLALEAVSAADGNFAATVNGEGIERARLQGAVDSMLQRTGGAAALRDPGHYKNVETQVLDVLIGQELLWQKAQEDDVVVSDTDVDAALAQIKQRFKSEEQFTSEISRGGFTADTYREDVRRRLSVQRYMVEKIAPGVMIGDQEVDEFYASNPERMKQPEEVRARHILIKVNPEVVGADQAAREKVEKLRAEIEAGADFAELAKQHSEGPSAPNGGDLGFFTRGQMVPPFEQTAFALASGEVSDAVKTRFGYHIIRVEERRGGGTIPKEQVAERIREYLKQRKVQENTQGLVQDLRADADVEVLLQK